MVPLCQYLATAEPELLEVLVFIRPVKRLITSQPTIEGAGVHLRRAFGFHNTSDFEPILLLDDIRNDYRRNLICT